ncbi:phosphoglycerate dehydrogenase [Planctomicrobium sp. SH664]|uniref:phosphoglycerate dehydrogenase n=1 Tax=Planctomicrobium sp. SH664 TaxID=3448125 RepID=UPI003F5B8F5F
MKIRCCALESDEGPHFPLLQSAGFEVLPGDRTLNYWQADALISQLAGCAGVIAGSEPYTRQVIEASPELRVIARTGVGYDAVDLAACDERQIAVVTTPGVNHEAVAEQTMAMLMAVARGYPDLDQRVRTGRWKRIATPRMLGRTLGLVGLGRTGQAVAVRALGLGLKVIASDPYPPTEFLKKYPVQIVSFDEVLATADYVSLHNPYSAQDARMMNAARFAQMKPGSIFINAARGGLVDEDALYEALKSGHLRSAALDVYQIEPLPLTSPLLTLSNILLSGHVAGLDEESQRDALTMAAENIIELSQGRLPAGRVQNLKHLTRFNF